MDKIRKASSKDIVQLKKVKPALTGDQALERLKKQSERLLEYLVLEINGEIVSFVLLKWHGKKKPSGIPRYGGLIYARGPER